MPQTPPFCFLSLTATNNLRKPPTAFFSSLVHVPVFYWYKDSIALVFAPK